MESDIVALEEKLGLATGLTGKSMLKVYFESVSKVLADFHWMLVVLEQLPKFPVSNPKHQDYSQIS